LYDRPRGFKAEETLDVGSEARDDACDKSGYDADLYFPRRLDIAKWYGNGDELDPSEYDRD